MLGCLYVKRDEDRFALRERTAIGILKIVLNTLEIKSRVVLTSEAVVAIGEGHGIFGCD